MIKDEEKSKIRNRLENKLKTLKQLTGKTFEIIEEDKIKIYYIIEKR